MATKNTTKTKKSTNLMTEEDFTSIDIVASRERGPNKAQKGDNHSLTESEVIQVVNLLDSFHPGSDLNVAIVRGSVGFVKHDMVGKEKNVPKQFFKVYAGGETPQGAQFVNGPSFIAIGDRHPTLKQGAVVTVASVLKTNKYQTKDGDTKFQETREVTFLYVHSMPESDPADDDDIEDAGEDVI